MLTFSAGSAREQISWFAWSNGYNFHLHDEDNLVRSRSAEALLMSPRMHTTHRLMVQSPEM